MKKHFLAGMSAVITGLVTLTLLSFATMPCAMAGALPAWGRYVAFGVFVLISLTIANAAYQSSLARWRDANPPPAADAPSGGGDGPVCQ